MASSSAKVLHLWDLETGESRWKTTFDDGWISAIAFSRDGKTLAVGSERLRADTPDGSVHPEGKISLLSPETGKESKSFTIGPAPSCLAFSPDGKLLAIGCSERSKPKEGDARREVIEVWSAETWQPVRSLDMDRPGVLSVAFSRDGKKLAAALSNEGAVPVWSVESGKILHTYREDEPGLTGVAFSPVADILVAGSCSGRIAVLDSGTGSVLRSAEWKDGRGALVPILSIAFGLDGKTIATGSAETATESDGIALWTADTLGKLSSVPGQRQAFRSIAFNGDGKTVAAGDSRGNARVWSVPGAKEIFLPAGGHQGPLLSVAMSPKGDLLGTSGVDRTLMIWSIDSGKEIRSLPFPEGLLLKGLRFSPDGQGLACICVPAAEPDAGPTGIRILSPASGELIRDFGDVPDASVLAFSPDGKVLGCGTGRRGEDQGGFWLWDAATGDKLCSVPKEEVQKRPASPSRESEPRLPRDLENLPFPGKSEEKPPQKSNPSGGLQVGAWAHDKAVSCLTFSPDGKMLATGSLDRTVKLWSLEGKEKVVFKGHAKDTLKGSIFGALQEEVRTLAFSPDGKSIASGSGDVLIWRPEEPESSRILDGNRSSVAALAFSGDGRFLAASDTGGRTVLWDAETGKRVGSWDLPGPVRTLGFLPSGTALISIDRNDDCTIFSTSSAEFETTENPGLPASVASQNKKIQSGSLVVSVLASGAPFNSVCSAYEDFDASILVVDLIGIIFQLNSNGSLAVLACGHPLYRPGFLVRDTISKDLIVTDDATSSIYRIKEGGKIQYLIKDHELGFLASIIQEEETGDYLVPDETNRCIHRISRTGQLRTWIRSPLLETPRGIVRDRLTREYVIVASKNLLRIKPDGSLKPLIKPHQRNPLNIPNGLAQDPTSGDFYVVESRVDSALYRVTAGGSIVRVSSLPLETIGLIQQKGSDRLIMTVNSKSNVLAFSGFPSASEMELSSWPGTFDEEARNRIRENSSN